MKTTIIILSVLSFILSCELNAQKFDGSRITGSGFNPMSESPLLLSLPQRWVDTTDIPPTPYRDGWIEFNGRGSMIRTAHNTFFDLPYSLTDSFRISLEIGFTQPKRSANVAGNFDPVSPNWRITWWDHFPGQYEFYIIGSSSTFAIAPVNESDTNFHIIELRWSKASGILSTYKDGILIYSYNSVSFDPAPSNVNYALCLGNRTEFQNPGMYMAMYSGGSNMFKGKMRSFVFAKNDTSYFYSFKSPSSQQVCPLMKSGGNTPVPYYPFEYADRHGTNQLYPAYNFFMNSGATHGIDTMDIRVVRGSIKNNYQSKFTNMSSISGFQYGVWIESYGGQLLYFNGRLYACGDFNTANGFTAFESDHDSARGVVWWNGNKWMQLGYGLRRPGGTGVMHIFEHRNDIIATGYFTEAVGVGPASYVALFDQEFRNWKTMGEGFNNVTFCGTSAFGDAYVGGFFTEADNIPCQRIAKWNGKNWEPLSGGLNSTPVYMQPKVWNGERGLLIGGYFDEVYNEGSSIYSPGLVFWSIDSSKYKSYYGLKTTAGAVYKIIEHDGWEYFVGDFPAMNGSNSYGICRFRPDGGIESIGSGIGMALESKAITSATIIGGKFFVGGQFTRFNGMLSSMVAGFDLKTGEIVDMGYGLDMRVEDVIEHEGNLVILGDNFMANGKESFIVTKYNLETKPISINQNEISVPGSFRLHQNYPNPFNPVTTIDFDLSMPASVSIKVFDILGREVRVLLKDMYLQQGTNSVTFDGSSISSGVYFYTLAVDNVVVGVKSMVMVK